MTARMRIIAGWELRQAVRSRWVAAIGAVLAVGSVVVTLLGLRQAGELGLGGAGTAATGLVNLAVLVPPLFALLLGLTSIATRPDRGVVTLFATQAMSRPALLVASFAGLAAALWLTLLFGFGISALVLAGTASGADLLPLASVAGATLATSTACLAVGVAVGAVSSSRGQATAAAVAVWFVLALGMDLALAGVAPALHLGPPGLLGALLANPVESGRVLALLGSDAGSSVLGPFGGYLRDGFGLVPAAALLLAALTTWVAAPLAAAAVVVTRRDA